RRGLDQQTRRENRHKSSSLTPTGLIHLDKFRADDVPITGDVGVVGCADVEAVESGADNMRRPYIAALGEHGGPFDGGGRHHELLPRGHGPGFEVVKHGRERFAETCEASASQPIEPFSRFGDYSLEGCLDLPDWIRKRQLHLQSMPAREQKLAEGRNAR
ncbi:hypothetical protein, partial [Arthrobacter sp. UYCo732]|uniref:hypothetical protein n=1 Tax=Arthrobacter sp. UYCo732 TaxID=3156336 RepID=UPI003394E2B9